MRIHDIKSIPQVQKESGVEEDINGIKSNESRNGWM